MSNIPKARVHIFPPIQPPPARESIGYLYEFYDGVTGFLGSLAVDKTDQAIGAEHGVNIKLDADLEIKRSFTKTATLKAGQVVRRICYPLQGREVSRPGGRW